jgi:hypothetical protein
MSRDPISFEPDQSSLRFPAERQPKPVGVRHPETWGPTWLGGRSSTRSITVSKHPGARVAVRPSRGTRPGRIGTPPRHTTVRGDRTIGSCRRWSGWSVRQRRWPSSRGGGRSGGSVRRGTSGSGRRRQRLRPGLGPGSGCRVRWIRCPCSCPRSTCRSGPGPGRKPGVRVDRHGETGQGCRRRLREVASVPDGRVRDASVARTPPPPASPAASTPGSSHSPGRCPGLAASLGHAGTSRGRRPSRPGGESRLERYSSSRWHQHIGRIVGAESFGSDFGTVHHSRTEPQASNTSSSAASPPTTS